MIHLRRLALNPFLITVPVRETGLLDDDQEL